MEQTRERSTSDMPRALVVMAAILLCARLIETGVSLAQSSTPQPTRESVQWQEMVPLNSPAALSRQEFVPPPVMDVSPDSMVEIEKVLSASRAQNKFVLYEFYAPWSDPCKKMENTSLSNAQVDKLIDEHFMPVRVTDRLKDLGKNPRLVTDLQKKFRIFAFPTLVIVDSEGETAATLVGNCSSLTTYRFLSRALHTLDLKSRATKIRSISWNEHTRNCSSKSHF